MNADLFSPLIIRWFDKQVGRPTELQRIAWEVISKGNHALITAPTGSGKTLAAFLWSLNQLVTGVWQPGVTRILYVSPLKALNNDIRENLLVPLEQLRHEAELSGVPWPQIRVATRSGDTSQADRRRMLREPPEILITTPESLNLLVSSKRARMILTGLQTVILDEIHAVAAGKRGTHLITAVDRLVLLSGEFQRVALSATVKPLDRVARFVGGFRRVGDEYQPRPVQIIQSDDAKSLEVRVHYPGQEIESNEAWWAAITGEMRDVIRANRSTLFFTNSRRFSEKMARLINESAGKTLAYSHHGSLSRELRTVVEKRLKAGELSAIVATNSLELGIDIGQLDEVVLIQTPPSVASTMQRLGRAGHTIGAVSRGRLYPLHGRDLLEAAVMVQAVAARDIEEVRPTECPLDVAAQVIVAMTGVEQWSLDDLFAFLRTSTPFHRLTRRDFDRVIDMLAGRFEETRIRELKPRISVDRLAGTVKARDGSLHLVYLSGGTIPDRGYYGLRLQGAETKIGELDEEFVWERKTGETFNLGTQSWRIVRIDHQNVEVVPHAGHTSFSPFWKGEGFNRDFHFSERVALFLERWEQDTAMLDGAEEWGLSPQAIQGLTGYLERQQEETGVPLPHRHHLLVERIRDTAGYEAGTEGITSTTVLHTMWGGRVNRPLSMILTEALERKLGRPVEVHHDNDAVMISIAGEDIRIDGSDLLALVAPAQAETLLGARIGGTGLFGARFRECAQIALLLPRPGPRRRMPLWLNRLRAKRLLEAVRDHRDFPILSETLRVCLQDDCDVPTLLRLMDELQSGEIRITEIEMATASPFATNLVWQQTGQFMYQDDTPWGQNLSEGLYREVALSSDLRPELDSELVRQFVAKLRRTMTGYAPAGADELLDWVVERIMISQPEWDELLTAAERDSGIVSDELLGNLAGKLCVVSTEVGPFVVAVESLGRIDKAFGLDQRELPVRLLGESSFLPVSFGGDKDALCRLVEEWMRYAGPIEHSALRVFTSDTAGLADDLVERGAVVSGHLTRGMNEVELCDRINLERLLALSRRERSPDLEALPAERLPLFVATLQGLTGGRGQGSNALKDVMEPLLGYPLPAALWEREVLQARLPDYRPAWLDSLVHDTDLMWLGIGNRRLTFCFAPDHVLFAQTDAEALSQSPLPTGGARYRFWDLQSQTGMPSVELTHALWDQAWAGKATSDSFSTVRIGVQTGFRAEQGPSKRPIAIGHSRRRRETVRFSRWNASRPTSGAWYTVPEPQPPVDEVEAEERAEERILQLLDRYGILFRDMLTRELPELAWHVLFRRIRILELSGQIVSGYFFKGVSGPQFVGASGLRLLREGVPGEDVFWMSAVDPASFCGVSVEGLDLPRRVPSTHLVYQGHRLVMVSQRSGRHIEWKGSPPIEAHDPTVQQCLRLFSWLVNREVQPLRIVRVETIDGETPQTSRYFPMFVAFGFRSEGDRLVYRPGVR